MKAPLAGSTLNFTMAPGNGAVDLLSEENMLTRTTSGLANVWPGAPCWLSPLTISMLAIPQVRVARPLALVKRMEFRSNTELQDFGEAALMS
jgi:hypothetical protein